MEINSAVLWQFAYRGLSITEGVAIDARLVQFASHHFSKEEIKKQREKRESPEGKLDKNGKPLKFFRDQESDWTVKNDKLSTTALQINPKKPEQIAGEIKEFYENNALRESLIMRDYECAKRWTGNDFVR